jgi:hypothetical protein
MNKKKVIKSIEEKILYYNRLKKDWEGARGNALVLTDIMGSINALEWLRNDIQKDK